MAQISFTDICSGSHGGVIYGQTKATTMTLTDVKAEIAYSGGKGGFASFRELAGTNLATNIAVTGTTSMFDSYFSHVKSSGNGGCFPSHD